MAQRPNLFGPGDQKIGQRVKKKFGMARTNPSTAIIREHTQSFGLGCPSVSVEYHIAVQRPRLTA